MSLVSEFQWISAARMPCFQKRPDRDARHGPHDGIEQNRLVRAPDVRSPEVAAHHVKGGLKLPQEAEVSGHAPPRV